MTKDEEAAIVPQIVDSVVPVTIDGISGKGDEAIATIENRAKILKTVTQAALAQTYPEDWVLFRDPKTGLVAAYLQDVGCQRVLKHYGILVENVTTPELRNHENDVFSYSVTGDGVCRFTGERIERMEGERFSDEDFIVKSGLAKSRWRGHVKKAARANLDGRITRKLAGLNSVPIQALEAAGIDTARCRKGRGYGTSAEQQGADIEVASGVKQSDGPDCPTHGVKMRFRPAGQNARGSYDAFWGCPKYPACRETIQHSKFLKQQKKKAKVKQEPAPPAEATKESAPAEQKVEYLSAAYASQFWGLAEDHNWSKTKVKRYLEQNDIDGGLVANIPMDRYDELVDGMTGGGK